jgi:hypothetical protein
MVHCCIPGCKSEQSNAVKVFKFPADDKRRQLWIIGCRRLRPDFVPGTCHRLCEVLVIASYDSSCSGARRRTANRRTVVLGVNVDITTVRYSKSLLFQQFYLTN